MARKKLDEEEDDLEDSEGTEDKYRAPALSKGLDILEHLASEAEGKSQAEIAKTLGRTTSEIFRMLMVLRKRGYVHLNEEDDRYSLTTKLFEIAHRHPLGIREDDLVARVRDVLVHVEREQAPTRFEVAEHSAVLGRHTGERSECPRCDE